jgi:hypothetical protein
MSTVFDRLGYNFETSRFGEAAVLQTAAANTLNVIVQNTPGFSQWQKDDLINNNVNTSGYFKNPTANLNVIIFNAANLITANANTANLNDLSLAANNLMIAINDFQSHTDNISGVTYVQDIGIPSYDTASGIGQLNMMNISKTDGVPSNTVGILGSFTSLFINDILTANGIQLNIYANELANSITYTIDMEEGNTASSNLSPTEITIITNYTNSTANVLIDRRAADWSFYQNSRKLAQDCGRLAQFNNMGITNTYLVNNVIGTDSLKQKLNS